MAIKKQPLTAYQKLENKYMTRIHNLFTSDKEARDIKNSLLAGKNEYLRVDRIESSSFDMDWVNKIEDCLPELGTIINNPKKTIKTVTDVVPVELAKKTNAESLRHLSMNSQYVKSIDKHGNITPEKILNISSDDEYHTYENRFIASLIKRLVLFVEKRYEYISKYAPFTHSEILYLKNESVVHGMKVNIETKVHVEKSAADEDIQVQSEYLKRVDSIRTYLKYYLNSEFMKMFRAEKMVSGNIIMTNILRKNPAYHKCYELYKFITGYNKAGANYIVSEDYHNVTKKHMEELNMTTFANFLALQGGAPSRIALAKKKKYAPKILNNLDDDLFIYGPNNKSDFDFIRVDDSYNKYVEKQLNKDLKEKPSKEVEKFFADDYKAKRKREIERAAMEKLKARKERERERLRIRQEKLQEEQRLEAERKRQEAERLKLLAREKRLQAIRKDITTEALKDKKEEENAQRKAKQEAKKQAS